MFREESAAVLRTLEPMARLAGSDEVSDWTTDELAGWWEDVSGSDEALEQASLLYYLLEALGESVPLALWEALVDAPPRTTVVMPNPALWHRLESATRAGRVGEVVLLSLVTLGEGGPRQANPLVLGRVLSSLRAISMTGEAHQMAVEAALAAGL